MVKKPRKDLLVKRRMTVVFRPDAGTFHEALESTYSFHHSGPKDPIRINPEPYPYKRVTLDRWKLSADALAWLFTGGGGETVIAGDVTYEKLTRNNRAPIPRGSRFAHIDGNPRNHRVDNLRLLERSPYQAVTTIGGVRICLGSYPTREEALRACNAARTAVGAGPVKTRNRGGVK